MEFLRREILLFSKALCREQIRVTKKVEMFVFGENHELKEEIAETSQIVHHLVQIDGNEHNSWSNNETASKKELALKTSTAKGAIKLNERN
jgi:hypothetical protein